MTPTIKEASQVLLGSSVLRDRFQEKYGKVARIDNILKSATGSGDTYKQIQMSILKNGISETKILNTLEFNNVNNGYLKAINSVHNAAIIARLNKDELKTSALAQSKVKDAIVVAFHDIENCGCNKDVTDDIESILRNEIYLAVGSDEKLSEKLLNEAEEQYISEVEKTVFAPYENVEPLDFNNDIDI
jgi:hypothetical protein